MNDFLAGILAGAAAASVLLAALFGDPHARAIAARDTELERLRAGLEFLLRSSDDPRERRYIAHVLDPDGDEAGA